MLWKDIISLISLTYTVNDMGDTVETEVPREVFADKQSIRQNEFYQAQSIGLQPELMFIVRSIEYAGEKKLEYNGKEYQVIRTYDKNGELTELICTGLVNS